MAMRMRKWRAKFWGGLDIKSCEDERPRHLFFLFCSFHLASFNFLHLISFTRHVALLVASRWRSLFWGFGVECLWKRLGSEKVEVMGYRPL